MGPFADVETAVGVHEGLASVNAEESLYWKVMLVIDASIKRSAPSTLGVSGR